MSPLLTLSLLYEFNTKNATYLQYIRRPHQYRLAN